MKKIAVFSGSNSSRSINQKLTEFTGSLIGGHSVKTIDLVKFEIPLYSEDLEIKGFPSGVKDLYKEISVQDGLVISVPEHNGSLPAFFKNILDWLSRFERPFLSGIKIFLMSTSPGGQGGRSSLEAAEKILPYFKGEVVCSFSLGSFNKNFSDGKIVDIEKKEELDKLVEVFLNSL